MIKIETINYKGGGRGVAAPRVWIAVNTWNTCGFFGNVTASCPYRSVPRLSFSVALFLLSLPLCPGGITHADGSRIAGLSGLGWNASMRGRSGAALAGHRCAFHVFSLHIFHAASVQLAQPEDASSSRLQQREPLHTLSFSRLNYVSRVEATPWKSDSIIVIRILFES